MLTLKSINQIITIKGDKLELYMKQDIHDCDNRINVVKIIKDIPKKVIQEVSKQVNNYSRTQTKHEQWKEKE